MPRASAAARLSQIVPRRVLRPLVGRLPFNAAGLRLLRMMTDAPARLARPVPGTLIDAVQQPGLRGEWVVAPAVRDSGRVILYLHGSAFTLMSARTHRPLVSRLSQRTALPCFSVDYRLAPEHPFPAASDDVMAAYRHLLAQGYRAADIVVAGDSAGGFLAVDLALQLARTDEPLPAALALFSPLVDLSLQLAADQERRTPDCLVTAADCRRLVDLYVGSGDRSDPRITMDFASVQRFPPTLVQAGGNEMLQADAQHLHRCIQASGNTSYLQVWPGQMHVFQNMSALTESATALRQAALFIDWAMRGSTTSERKCIG
ncbi:hypothetical protein BST33_12720 [Mycolicibacter minnesotensis]|uniref:Alpha/beta hydrolase fold-3 domain-containing protein n=1 Tax=Mycolicibacter minnesotensis TaxID=1118379 RepID=A0AA91RLQ8_9MYCO|nr:hypothetical protein BST33_12720 [Mycolicibacter minnesotensis]